VSKIDRRMKQRKIKLSKLKSHKDLELEECIVYQQPLMIMSQAHKEIFDKALEEIVAKGNFKIKNK
jgi:hypothetical protein